MDLIGILDTEKNRHTVEQLGNLEKDKALVKKVRETLRKSTFKEFINYMIDNVETDEKDIANEVGDYLKQHNGLTTICEIRPCDSEGNYISTSPTFIDLNETVEPYISSRNIDGENFDCIEVVLDQITAVGYYVQK